MASRVALSPRVRRALLYLQGFDGKKIAKASSHPTLDCACLDMEDGVGVTMKEQAREGIVHALQTVDFGRTEVLARINAFDTGDLALRDLDSIIRCPVLPDGIVIPKVENEHDVNMVSERLDALGDVAHDTRIICMIESPKSVLNMPAICQAAPHRMDCIIFGGDDYASAVGATRTKNGSELHFARNFALMQASSYNVACIDIVLIDFHDEEQLRKESRQSSELGFIGKQVIHPKQIDPVQQEYSPTKESIKHAAAVVQANKEHQLHGKGAFSFEGKMIDAPTVKQYENLLQRAMLMGLHRNGSGSR
jgi:citrate lyase subunit beta-like protein